MSIKKQIKKEIRACYNVFFNNKKKANLIDRDGKKLIIEKGNFDYGAKHSIIKHYFSDYSINRNIVAKIPLFIKDDNTQKKLVEDKRELYLITDDDNNIFKLPYATNNSKLITFYGSHKNKGFKKDNFHTLFKLNSSNDKKIIVKLREIAKFSSDIKEFKMFLKYFSKVNKISLTNKYFKDYSNKAINMEDFFSKVNIRVVGGHNATPDSKNHLHNPYAEIVQKNKEDVNTPKQRSNKFIKNKFNMVVIIGESGAGKTVIANKLAERDKSTNKVVTFTTRNKREKEIDGVDYFFMKNIDVEKAILEKKAIEYSVFNGAFYGCLKSSLDKNKINVIVLEPSGISKYANNKEVNILNIFNIETDLNNIENRIDDKARLKNLLERRNQNEIMKEFQKIPLELQKQIINVDNNEDIEKPINKIEAYLRMNALNIDCNISESTKIIENFSKKNLNIQKELK